MLKLLSITFIIFFSCTSYSNIEIRKKIGSVFSSPVLYKNKYYFISTAGVLFEADKNFQQISKLFEGKKQSLGGLSVQNGILYWGEGLHSDKKSNFYIYDISLKKMISSIELDGHVERTPLITSDTIYVPAGSGGTAAIDLKTNKIKWSTKDFNKKNIHIDSNLFLVGQKVCGTVLYDLKGIMCFDERSGKVVQFFPLKKNPKSEIALWNKHIVGFATEANLVQSKWDIPSDFYVYDVENNKLTLLKELRGHNFFAPMIEGNVAFVTLSTGDFILINLTNGKIQFIGEFPEPFVNNAFMKNDEYCAVGVMGKYLCFSKSIKDKSPYSISTDKRIMEIIVGKILIDNNGIIAPTRMGYHKE